MKGQNPTGIPEGIPQVCSVETSRRVPGWIPWIFQNISRRVPVENLGVIIQFQEGFLLKYIKKFLQGFRMKFLCRTQTKPNLKCWGKIWSNSLMNLRRNDLRSSGINSRKIQEESAGISINNIRSYSCMNATRNSGGIQRDTHENPYRKPYREIFRGILMNSWDKLIEWFLE